MITGDSNIRQSKDYDPRIIDCIIGSVTNKVLLDSGAMVNTVTPSLYEKIRQNSWSAIQNVKLHPVETLKGYGSDKPIEDQCSFDAFVSAKNSKQPAVFTKFFVVSGANLSLLGYKTAISLNLLRIGNQLCDFTGEHQEMSLGNVDIV